MSATTDPAQPKGCRQTLGTIVVSILLLIATIVGSLTGVDVSGVLGVGGTAQPNAGTRFPATPTPFTPGNVVAVPVGQGLGAKKGFWEVYFTAPTGSRDAATYVNGIEMRLVEAINAAQASLDIAAFEWNLPALTQAVIAAHQRGVVVRMVVDDEHALRDTTSTIGQVVQAGVPVVADQRSGFMHDKFMILDRSVVWTGSWNYSINDTYRNNNNAMSFRSRAMVENFQAEFDEMFTGRQFGPTSPSNTPKPSFTQDGTPMQVYFGSEDRTIRALNNALNSAKSSILFMAFSFTLPDVASIVETKAIAGVQVAGIIESTGSTNKSGQLTPLACAGLAVRQDGSSFILHHKVFIIDATTVVMGSFNFSDSARDQNDENMVIITDPDLAQLYIAEFSRRWAEAKTPTGLVCS